MGAGIMLLPYQMPERQPPNLGYRYVVQGEYIKRGTRALWIGEPCEIVNPLYVSYFMGFPVTGSSTECIVKFIDGKQWRVMRQFLQIEVLT